MEFVKQYLLSKNIPLDEKKFGEFAQKNIRTEFKKKDLILKAGEVENYLSFVEKGIARLFFEKENKSDLFLNISILQFTILLRKELHPDVMWRHLRIWWCGECIMMI